MAVKYRLVLRKDMSKDAPEDGKLVYAVSSSTGMCDTNQMCEIIADRSAATAGDVKLVLDGIMHVLQQKLPEGQTVQLGELGYIQAVLGSKGAATEKDFTANMDQKPAHPLPSRQAAQADGGQLQDGALHQRRNAFHPAGRWRWRRRQAGDPSSLRFPR